jgi:tetratricopeptide (TPR) repeat protein
MRAFAIVLPLVLVAATARAQAPDAEAQARAHYDKGLVAFDLSKWDEAIAEFKAAYTLYKAPGFLFNIAQAYRLKGDKRKAVDAYRSYLRLDPNAPNKAEVDGHIARLEKAIDEERSKPPATTPPTAVPDKTPPTSRPASDKVMRVDANVMRVEVKGTSKGNKTMMNAGLITAAGGLALVGLGAYYGVKASGEWDDVEVTVQHDGPWTPGDHKTWRDAEKHETWSQILFAVGGVAVATGGVLTLFGSGAAEPLFSAAPAPGGATFVVRGGF